MSTNDLASVIANRTALSLARSERLIASWLPAPSAGPTGAEAEEHETNNFSQEAELSGLGFRKRDSGEAGQGGSTNHADNELRKRLLGKRKRPEDKRFSKATHGPIKARPHNGKVGIRAGDEDSGDEEEGRSAVGKARRQNAGIPAIDETFVDTTQSSQTKEMQPNTKTRPRARTVLDEVLEQNAQKRKKKKKKKANSNHMAEM